MQILLNIAQYLIPILIKFVDKYSDDFLELLYKRIKNIVEDKTVAKIKFDVMNTNGEQIVNANVIFNLDLIGEIEKKSVNEQLSVSGLSKGTYDFVIKAEGYKDKVIPIEFKTDKCVIDKAVIMEAK